jgi:hypothetical protein
MKFMKFKFLTWENIQQLWVEGSAKAMEGLNGLPAVHCKDMEVSTGQTMHDG